MSKTDRNSWIAVAVAILSMVATISGAYFHNDRALGERLATLEQSKADMDGKLDHIQNQVDRLVSWAMPPCAGCQFRMSTSDSPTK